jgi:hypothetical protein
MGFNIGIEWRYNICCFYPHVKPNVSSYIYIYVCIYIYTYIYIYSFIYLFSGCYQPPGRSYFSHPIPPGNWTWFAVIGLWLDGCLQCWTPFAGIVSLPNPMGHMCFLHQPRKEKNNTYEWSPLYGVCHSILYDKWSPYEWSHILYGVIQLSNSTL